MATDVEESDTDDHPDKPGPACKKQRIISSMYQNQQSTSNAEPNNQQSPLELQQQLIINEEENEDEQAREKLRCWQACQVAKGFVDNTINRVIENYRMSPPMSHPFEDPWYCLLRGNQMEDTAVSMAIRNHGLVRSLDLIQFPSLINKGNGNVPQCTVNMQASVTASSSETLVLTDSEAASNSGEGDSLDDTYDSDHQQNFLDRAVAEAIKKKGLSTLNVDYS